VAKSYTVSTRLLAHYRRTARDLPWRRTHDPYEVLVSEVMLQQTQASRVTPAFDRFILRFPTLRALAAAPLGAVLVGWMCDRGGTELAFGVGGFSAIAMTGVGAVIIRRPRRTAPPRVQPKPVAERIAA
jgi:hypothetical protein